MELAELKNVDLTLKDLATEIVRYQKFSTKAFVSKVQEKFNKYSKATLANYLDGGVNYIRAGLKRRFCSKKFYRYMDEALEQHVQPLTPNASDKRREHSRVFCNKKAKLPIQKVVDEIKKTELVEKFEYGVRFGNNVKVFKTQQEAALFLGGVLFASDDSSDARLVSVQNLDGFM